LDRLIRILFLNHNVVRRGGTFYRAYHVARYLVQRGHAVTLLSISPHRRWGFQREISAGVEIIQTPDLLWGIGRTGWDPWDTVCRIAYLHNQHWDIVHAWDCRPAVILPALYARRRSRKYGCKLVIDWCDWWGRGGTQSDRPGRFAKMLYGPVETFFEESFRTRADGTTVASRALRDRAIALGVPDEPLMILPGGSDTETVRPVESPVARAQLGISASDWVVGYLGALPATEVDLLTSALTLARSDIQNLRFLAVGVSIAGSSLSLRAAIGERWGDWITEIERISFDQVGLYLSACDAVVLAMRCSVSNIARWPSKINDYLAAGRPIVATNVGEVERLFQHGVGRLAKDDARSLADGIVYLARHRAEAEQFGKQGRALAEGELNWSNLAKRLEEFYERVHSGSGRQH
jgi:glycosyltransferase involved in cell wall biosynthesis